MQTKEQGLNQNSLKNLIKILRCIYCNNKKFDLKVNSKVKGSILEGKLICKKCRDSYNIKNGIIIALPKKLNTWVQGEKDLQEDSSSVENNSYIKSLTIRSLYNYLFSQYLWRHMNDNDKNDFIIEIGCGNGFLLERLIHKKPKFGLVVGLDICFNALLNAKKRVGLNNLILIQADSNNLPFIDKSFNNVLTQGVLHHIKSAKITLKEMNRIIKKEGIITIQDKNANNFLIPFLNGVIVHSLFNKLGETTLVKKAINHGTVKKFLNKNGYKINSLKFHDIIAWPSSLFLEEINIKFFVSSMIHLDKILSKIPIISSIFSWRYTIIAEKVTGVRGDKSL